MTVKPISRIFQPNSLAASATIKLSENASHHLARVLRAKIGDEIILFNGEGGEYLSVISHIDKKNISVSIKKLIAREVESPLELYLAQGISRGEKMDYTIQKAVELGVKKIIPLFTERCNVKLDEERREKKLQHWQAIAVSACEQSGRNRVPEILLPQLFDRYIENENAEWKFILSPHVSQKMAGKSIGSGEKVVLLIGPEGGLSDQEIARAEQKSFLPLNLGPRVLRTETAAVAAITALQCWFGDFS